MVNLPKASCNDAILDRYLNKDLTPEEKLFLKAHLDHCQRCRCKLEVMITIARNFRDIVQSALNEEDFAGLEKEICTAAVQQVRIKKGPPRIITFLKVILAISIIAGVLLLCATLQL